MEIISSGAEAVLYRNENGDVVKERKCKSYRLVEIDNKLRKFRTKREAKVLLKLQNAGIPAPYLKQIDEEKMMVTMNFIEGSKVRDVLQNNPKLLSVEIGRKIGLLHNNSIIHSDLTTSNMIFDGEVKFIDFGLSFFSQKVEDKAVDLHLFRQALESKHNDIWQECFTSAIEGYRESCSDASDVLDRLEKVEKRGRNKGK